MKIFAGSALFFALVLLGGGQTGYCKNNTVVSQQKNKPVAIARGSSGEISVTFTIKDGYHIQANLVNNEFLIPASLKINAGENIVPGEPIYPAGNPYILEGSEEILLTYEKEVVIRLPVAVQKSAEPGTENVAGEFYFQPCTSSRCLAPRSIPVSLPVDIIAPGSSRGRSLR